MSHHHGETPRIANIHELSTSSQTYFLTIVTDGMNTAAEISAEDPTSQTGRTLVGRGYAKRHKRDARDNRYGEVLAVKRAFEAAGERYAAMIDEYHSQRQFSAAMAPLLVQMSKGDKRALKDAKRKEARERFRRENGFDHTTWTERKNA